MGHDRAELRKEHPWLAQLYDTYSLCRELVFVTYRRPERDGKETQIVVPWASGLHLLPRFGGVDDQNYIEMRMFNAFLRGERQAAMWMMRK